MSAPAFVTHWGEVDGVPTLWSGQGAVQGPLQACLLFGAGICDETLPSSGIDHLIEHLALQRLGNRAYQLNGQARPVSTVFRVMGDAEEIVEFFGHVACELRELPIDRLTDEARVLRVEGQRRKAFQAGFDLSLRYGPFGEGLLGWPEYGLSRLQADEVNAWARARFTAQNAVLWLSGPIPPGLSLAGLPQGAPPVRATARHQPLPSRCWATAATTRVSLSIVAGLDQWGLPAAVAIARRRALERLRAQDAISYAVEHVHLRIGGAMAFDYLMADCAEASHRRVLDGLVGAVEELVASGPTTEELETYKRMSLQVREHPQAVVGYLESTAERRLLGQWAPNPSESEEKLLGLTADQLREELAAALPSLLAVGPRELGANLPGWSTYPTWSPMVMEGKTYAPIAGREKGHLVVGDAGVSWALDEERRRTVRWADAVACFTWDNGVRTLLGPTGAEVQVVPWNWQGGEDLPSLVDASLEPGRLIRLGEGQTQRRENPNSAASLADVRWLASIVGARQRKNKVDVLVDTESLYVLQQPPGCQTGPRLAELRVKDRKALLAENPLNLCLPLGEIESVELAKRPFVSFDNHVKDTVLFHTKAGQPPLKIQFATDDAVQKLRIGLMRALGDRVKY